jgi:hypothetical protein
MEERDRQAVSVVDDDESLRRSNVEPLHYHVSADHRRDSERLPPRGQDGTHLSSGYGSRNAGSRPDGRARRTER